MVPIMEEYLSWIKPKVQTRRLLEKVRDIWNGYLRHPFVCGIGDGSLNKEKFRFYLKQDYLYLIEYAKVFAVGIAKSNDAEIIRFLSGVIHQIFTSEMNIHRAYMRRFGVTDEEIADTTPSLDNRSYTSYMLRVAYEDGETEILAAILACAWSYEVIARNMVKVRPEAVSDPFYGDWVKGYVSDRYARDNVILLDAMDRLSEDYSEAQLQHLEEIFVACSRYELAFWQMAWEMRL